MKVIRIIFVALITLIIPQTVLAFGWQDFWYRSDQQGVQALNRGKPQQAAQLFSIPEWQAVAYYRAGQYQQVVDILAAFDDPEANYNRGNALTHLGQYQAAIAAYDRTLAQMPNHADAKFNRDLAKQLLQHKSAQQDKSAAQDQAEQQGQPQVSAELEPQQFQEPQDQATANNENQTEENTDNANKQPQDDDNSLNQQTIQADNQAPNATQQWLHQIPDDPGGLLRQKFLREHQQREARKSEETT